MCARHPALLALLLVLLPCVPLSAATISYLPIAYGETWSDGVQEDSHLDPAAWDYWSFSGNAGDIVTITVRREVGSMDPVFALWDGLEADTGDYSSLYQDSAHHAWLGTGDDELPPAVPGPWGDAQLTVTLGSSGDHAIAVAESGNGGGSGSLLGYNINLERTVVPLPPALSLLLSVLPLLLLFRRCTAPTTERALRETGPPRTLPGRLTPRVRWASLRALRRLEGALSGNAAGTRPGPGTRAAPR